MVGNYPVITLCGSTKFKEEFMQVQKELTLAGNIVISVGCFGHSGDVFTEDQKIMLDDMHKRKIDMSDEIFVINVNGYIGESTKSEIEYALSKHKIINYLIQPIQPNKAFVVSPNRLQDFLEHKCKDKDDLNKELLSKISDKIKDKTKD